MRTPKITLHKAEFHFHTDTDSYIVIYQPLAERTNRNEKQYLASVFSGNTKVGEIKTTSFANKTHAQRLIKKFLIKSNS